MDTDALIEELITQVNLGQLSDAQLSHIMDVCEVEIVNRMAANAGYVEEGRS